MSTVYECHSPMHQSRMCIINSVLTHRICDVERFVSVCAWTALQASLDYLNIVKLHAVCLSWLAVVEPMDGLLVR